MKKIILLLLAVFINNFAFSQYAPAYTCVVKKKNNAKRCPILKTTSYAAILNGSINKEQLIETTKKLLKSEGIEVTQNDTYKYDDNLKSINLRLKTYGGMFLGNVGYGLKTPKAPVYLSYDLILKFNNENQMMVEFTNFKSNNLVVVADNAFAFDVEKKSPVLYKMSQNFYADTAPKQEKKKQTSGKLFSLKLKLGKKNKGEKRIKVENNIKEELGLDNAFKKREKFRENLAQEKKVVIEEEKKNPYVKWVYDADLANYKWKGNKYYGDWITTAVANEEVIGVTQDRFHEYFLKNFDFYIKDLATNTNSTINQVALDGEIMYENVNGEILPTDKKLRKKWKRKGIKY